MEIFETPLPGIGVRYELTTAAGDPLGVVVRRDGRRQIVVYDRTDPDRTRASLLLTPSEASALVELLGGSKVTERLAALRQDVEGLSIEWVTLPSSGGLTGQTIGDGAVRSRTGASVVAVIRGEQSIPGPGPEFQFAVGDVALVIGAITSVRAAVEVLSG
jgi:TrkA domain protein